MTKTFVLHISCHAAGLLLPHTPPSPVSHLIVPYRPPAPSLSHSFALPFVPPACITMSYIPNTYHRQEQQQQLRMLLNKRAEGRGTSPLSATLRPIFHAHPQCERDRLMRKLHTKRNENAKPKVIETEEWRRSGKSGLSDLSVYIDVYTYIYIYIRLYIYICIYIYAYMLYAYLCASAFTHMHMRAVIKANLKRNCERQAKSW